MTTQQLKSWLVDCGQIIITERKRLGMSQQTLATKSGVYQGRLSLIERGQVEPSLFQLLSVFEVLGLAVYINTIDIEYHQADEAYVQRTV